MLTRWPEAPPYGGVHDDVVPHLTVAEGPPAVLDAIQQDLEPRLPLTTTVKVAELYVFDGRRWRVRERMPFRAAVSEL